MKKNRWLITLLLAFWIIVTFLMIFKREFLVSIAFYKIIMGIWNIISVVMLSVLVWKVISWIYKKIASSFNKNQLMTKKDWKKNIKEKFPKYYGFLYAFMIIMVLLFAISCIFFVGTKIPDIQEKLISQDASVIFIPSGAAFFVFVMVSFFVGIFMGLFILAIIFHKFPKLERYSEMKQMAAGGPKYKITNSTYKIQMKLFIKMLIIFLVIAIPLCLLAFNTYSYVNKEGVTINSFWGLNEKHYPWSDVKEISLSTYFNNKQRGNANYYIVFEDNNRLNIFGGKVNVTKTKEIHKFVLLNNIFINREKIDYYAYSDFNARRDAEQKKELNDIFLGT
jgi:hypothetical protein